MKKNVIRVVVAALMVCAAGTARAVTTHRMTDTDISYSGGFITTSGVLVFPGKTLADLEGHSFWGTMGGGSFGAVKTGLSNQVKPYPANATGAAIQRQQRHGGAERVWDVQARRRPRLLLRLHDAGRIDDRPLDEDDASAACLRFYVR